MKWTAFASAAAIALVSLSAGAAPAERGIVEKSPDVLKAAQWRARKAAARAEVPLVLSPSALAAAAAAPTVEEVGDADSFGRNVTYLGLVQSQPVFTTSDCTGSDPTLERCIVAAPAPGVTVFNEANLGTLSLPKNASKSLLCFTLTPFIFNDWQNFTGSPQLARFSAVANITITNPVLDDPTLIDPNTGLPFGGRIDLGLTTWSKTFTLQPNEISTERSTESRACIAGIISKRALVDNYGLTEPQATQFFKKAMTLTLGAQGTVAMSDFTQYFYGLRIYGD
jgi:hypothetical protein